MATFVKEYDWMWLPSGLNLSPAECRVYAYIYGLTESKHSKTKGYNGSVRQLAKVLGLDDSGVSRILRKLQDKQIILTNEGAFMSADIFRNSADSVRSGADLISSDADSVRESADSVSSPLTTPLYKEINKEMERDNNIARDTIATQNSQPLYSFATFVAAYSAKRSSTYDPEGEQLDLLSKRWYEKPAFERVLLTKAVQAGKWFRPRMEWTISDFRVPEPTNYNGSQDLNRMAENNEMVVALYNGTAGIYTKQDAEDYGMLIKRPFKL